MAMAWQFLPDAPFDYATARLVWFVSSAGVARLPLCHDGEDY